ncbi:hypothetical protein B0H16DRAFT_1455474 [Mycena metata]|uniref:Uncharacterized protein n=1 Tax=Mycena metata TaxID=1033252 RepID=A0AAD7JGW5_9AGAR|nr:hypothetical protein B0H16DRAFT_1455474 [Mycena metata]
MNDLKHELRLFPFLLTPQKDLLDPPIIKPWNQPAPAASIGPQNDVPLRARCRDPHPKQSRKHRRLSFLFEFIVVGPYPRMLLHIPFEPIGHAGVQDAQKDSELPPILSSSNTPSAVQPPPRLHLQLPVDCSFCVSALQQFFLVQFRFCPPHQISFRSPQNEEKNYCALTDGFSRNQKAELQTVLSHRRHGASNVFYHCTRPPMYFT